MSVLSLAPIAVPVGDTSGDRNSYAGTAGNAVVLSGRFQLRIVAWVSPNAAIAGAGWDA